ncbi:MAG: bifunctional nuclease family protein [Planctomycetota bacterium]|nr:bifunctional nuclease family protein [Planctomycetota bacterium]
MIAVELSQILINDRSDEQLIFLKEIDGDRQLRIVLRIFEALLIDRVLKGTENLRPLTHDLLIGTIHALDAELDKVIINEVHGQVFHAQLVLIKDGEEVFMDARPSDGITLALKSEVPLYVESSVFESSSEKGD